MKTCLTHTFSVARPPSALKHARDDTSRALGSVGKLRNADDRLFTTPRASPRAGTCQASGGWLAKPSRPKGRGARPSPASTLMSLLTASVDAGDDGTSQSPSGVASGDASREADAEPPPVKRIPDDRVATHPKLRTVSGEPVRAFALGGNRETRQDANVVAEAYARGVNYFFAYSMDDASIGDYLDGLRALCSDPWTRRKIFVAVGMEDFTDKEKVTDHVARCLARLGTDYVDAFFMEYVCRGDEDAAVDALEWMRGAGGLVVADRPGARAGIDGPVRFVGCSTHDRCVGVRLLRSERNEDGRDVAPRGDAATEAGGVTRERGTATPSPTSDAELSMEFANKKPCALDLMMARYNMAHAKAEWRLFPVARTRDVPIIAFTSTRWNSLQKGHPQWPDAPPSTATCMRWAAAHPAVQVVLNSAPDAAYLSEWTDELSDATSCDVEKWRAYGELVYDESAAFETLF